VWIAGYFGSGLSVMVFSHSITILILFVLTYLGPKTTSTIYIICEWYGKLRITEQHFDH